MPKFVENFPKIFLKASKPSNIFLKFYNNIPFVEFRQNSLKFSNFLDVGSFKCYVIGILSSTRILINVFLIEFQIQLKCS